MYCRALPFHCTILYCIRLAFESHKESYLSLTCLHFHVLGASLDHSWPCRVVKLCGCCFHFLCQSKIQTWSETLMWIAVSIGSSVMQHSLHHGISYQVAPISNSVSDPRHSAAVSQVAQANTRPLTTKFDLILYLSHPTSAHLQGQSRLTSHTSKQPVLHDYMSQADHHVLRFFHCRFILIRIPDGPIVSLSLTTDRC